MTSAYVALGSNMGDRLSNLGEALRILDGLPDVDVTAVSSAYESEPWGVADQPAFANAVARLEVRSDAAALLRACKRIEERLGRRSGERYGPRPIDLDVLLFGERSIDTPDLTVPHPRLLERDFVLRPLLELDPDVRLPGGGRVARGSRLVGRVTGVLGPVPGFADARPRRPSQNGDDILPGSA